MPRGRKRMFDEDAALQTAMELFWRQGYEGTSIADITQALGIQPPSLYAAFGSKRELFEKALDRYMARPTADLREAMARPTAREVALHLLTSRVEAFIAPGLPRGCMTVRAGLACGEAHSDVVDLLAAVREETRKTVLERFEKAVADGDLPAGTDCGALARCLMATIYGLSVEAASGAPREELLAAATFAAQLVPAG
ncbi:TetR/AcrR family transcriptional regulator [Streptomyces sp. DT2A-34]|uniref:TetR/AcrR family transcriptional regulator n=1 Tax=Streptomyces sp. DT2A-34 TaxID=3051182 RepID=UPI00265BD8CD|nr:TetR/AcrR family transcriptional regulator [Streptomyces sp. DT2A-34]MDO0916723.1 TetR/AcrR family transcriptional regulator [Streptomyces sp. DT2A-34]